jgi:hypothetical protein
VEVIPLAVVTPKNNPLLSKDTDPPVTAAENPSLSTRVPPVTVPLELMVTVPLVQPGSLKEGWDDPKKSKICQVPAKSAVEKIASASTGKAKSIQITKIHN